MNYTTLGIKNCVKKKLMIEFPCLGKLISRMKVKRPGEREKESEQEKAILKRNIG